MSDQPKPWENRLIGLVHVFGETQPDTEGRTQVMQRILRLVEDELRRQHSRIEADEALMRQAFDALKFGHPNPAVQEEKQRAITALRKRLESSK